MLAGRNFRVQSGLCVRAAATRCMRRRAFRVQALCRACRLAPPPFVRAVSYGVYQGRMREAIHALKYDRLHPAARGLGRMLAEAIAQLAGEAPAEMLVVPVPLHRSKYAQRGFNQARSLAAEALGVSAQEPSGVAADVGVEHADAAARHGEPGGTDPAAAAAECARRVFGFRSGASGGSGMFCWSTTF